MANKGKSIDELKEKVHSGLDLLSDEDLASLFEDAESIAQETPANTQPTSEPSPAPASADPTPPVGETPKGQANLMNLVPDKFKGEDEAASLSKMIKALQEQEAALTQRSQEVSQLQNVVQELSRKPREEYRPAQPAAQPAAQPKTPEPEVEVDDMGFLDAPVANTKAIATQVAKQVAEEVARRISVEQLKDYDTFALRRTTFEKFRADHSDFDTIRTEFSEACKLHPEWDNDVNGLPKLYELAKTLAKARGVAPAATSIQPSPGIDIEKLTAEITAKVEAGAVEKAKQAILEEIKKRRAAAGIISTSPGSTPADRVAIASKTVPLTPEEQAIADMVNSGPNKLDRELGPYGPILNLERAAR